MKLICFTLLAIISVLPCWGAHADDPMIFQYSRKQLTIYRNQLPEPPTPDFPWQEPVKEAPRIQLDVEIRDAHSMYRQEGWFSFTGPKGKHSVMMVFPQPEIAPLMPTEQYAPLDILMVNKEGKIFQIVPDLVLAKLEEYILPPSPALAFIFLEGGFCQRYSVTPGDYVEYALFKQPPPVLTAPANSPKPPHVPSSKQKVETEILGGSKPKTKSADIIKE